MATRDLYERLNMLGFPVLEVDSPEAANVTLAEVVRSKDIRLWEGFPVMLANSIQKQWFNYDEICRYLGSIEEAPKLDSLIDLSLALYEVVNLKAPQIDRFRGQFGPKKAKEIEHFVKKLRNNEEFVLSNQTMSTERMKTAFSSYYGGQEARLIDLLSEQNQYDLNHALSQIFSPGQKALIMKKLKGEKLTKTEREYFSRVVRKKLLALANPDLYRLSQKLLS